MKRVLNLLAVTAMIGTSVGCCHGYGYGGGCNNGCQSGGCGYGAAPGVYQGAYYGGTTQQAAMPYGATTFQSAGVAPMGTTASASGYMYGPSVPVTASANVNPLPTF